MSKFDNTVYTEVIVNTANRAVLSSEKIRKWREDTKRVVDEVDAALGTHLDERATPTKLGHVYGFRGALVRKNANQSIPTGVATTLSWQTTIYGFEDIFKISTPTRLTVPTGVRKIRLTASAVFALNTAGYRSILFLKNSSDAFIGRSGITIPAVQTIGTALSVTSPVLDVVAGDYFELGAHQTSGVSVNVDDWWSTFFSMEVIE